MTTDSLLLDRDAVRSTLDEWAAEQKSIDAELSESLAALAAYQSHLDAWQQQLAQERDELRQAREQLDRDRAAAADNPPAPSAQALADANAELESSRAREADLAAALQEQQAGWEIERAQLMSQVRELTARLESGAASASPVDATAPTDTPTVPTPPASAAKREPAGTSAVLGSIVEQFGKLRLQRANDRQLSKKIR